MKEGEPAPSAAPPPGTRTYQAICLAALVVAWLALVQRGAGLWSALPLLIGGLGVVSRLRAAPLLFLLGIIVAKVDWWGSTHGYWSPLPLIHAADIVLAGAVLSFVAGHFRLQGLELNLIPSDPRRSPAEGGRRKAEGGRGATHPPSLRLPPSEAARLRRLVALPEKRSAHLATSSEIGQFLVTLPLCLAAAYLFYLQLPEGWRDYGFDPRTWRLLALTWALGLLVLIGASGLSYLARWRMSRPEAALVVQDILWREIAAEQRRIDRWLAWAQLRRNRGKEKT